MSRTCKTEWSCRDGWQEMGRQERKARPAGRLLAQLALDGDDFLFVDSPVEVHEVIWFDADDFGGWTESVRGNYFAYPNGNGFWRTSYRSWGNDDFVEPLPTGARCGCGAPATVAIDFGYEGDTFADVRLYCEPCS